MDNESPNVQGKKSPLPIAAAVSIGLILGAVYWYWQSQKIETPLPPVVEPPAAAAIENPDLGSGLLEKAQNPIKDQLPETVAPVPNPLEGLYKNPFE